MLEAGCVYFDFGAGVFRFQIMLDTDLYVLLRLDVLCFVCLLCLLLECLRVRFAITFCALFI